LQQRFKREMSSPLPFQPSSPAPGNGIRRKSQFTYRQLAQLALSSTTCPLRVIAHVDLDAFYAQCEMVRLGVAEDQPLAVQQWYSTTSLMLDRMLANVEDPGRV
jgi:DNA polymerase eta